MEIVFKEPGKPVRGMVIDGSLQTMQQLVGGYIEHVSLGNSLGCLMNEEGKLLGLEPNGFYYNGDPLVGNLIFLGEDGEEFTDIPDSCREILMSLEETS